METLKNYIDFQKMWNDIKDDWKDCLEDIDNENISNFIKNEPFELDLDECAFGPDSVENEVVFVFSKEYQTANESDNTNEFSIVRIVYEIDSERFQFYEEEHG